MRQRADWQLEPSVREPMRDESFSEDCSDFFFRNMYRYTKHGIASRITPFQVSLFKGAVLCFLFVGVCVCVCVCFLSAKAALPDDGNPLER